MTRAEYQAYLASRDWALKREAVRERSGGRCERCWANGMDAVHHKTYERVGNERLDDLQAICDPCHEFLSGKTNADPISDGVAVYLAGPFTAPEWRRELLQGGRDAVLSDDELTALLSDRAFTTAPRALRGEFDCAGPWRIRNASHEAHGLLSGHPGRGALGCPCCTAGETVVAVCKKAIASSDVVFCWLPDRDLVSAGTLWELGYASAMGKATVVARPERTDWDAPDDYWFPVAAADHWIWADTPGKAWNRFVGEAWPDCRRSQGRPA